MRNSTGRTVSLTPKNADEWLNESRSSTTGSVAVWAASFHAEASELMGSPRLPSLRECTRMRKSELENIGFYSRLGFRPGHLTISVARELGRVGAHDGQRLTAPLGLSQPTVSHHLKVLADAGLLEREQRGRWAYYRVVPERLELLRGALVTPAASAIV